MLSMLSVVSGIVVDVRLITGYTVRPLYPGLVRLDVGAPFQPAHAQFAGARLRPAAGSPWQRLRHPPARAELSDRDDHGATSITRSQR